MSDSLNDARPVDEAEAAEIQAAAAVASDVRMVPLALIEKSDVSLRDVDRSSEQFVLLVESIKKVGVLNSILVREIPIAGGGIKYGLIDGLQRFTASLDAGRVEIPARVVNMDDAELLEAQCITNLVRVQTKPAEVSKHFLRILARNPYMTLEELAGKVCQSRTYVEQRLSLVKLLDDIQKLVNEGEIHLTNAYALAKIPQDEQAQYVDAAMTDPPKVFVPRMKERLKAINEAKKKGRDPESEVFKPVSHLQKIKDVQAELDAIDSDPASSKILTLVRQHNVNDPVEIIRMAVLWSLHLDPESSAEQERAHAKRMAQREEEKARRKAEREQKKAEDAASKQQDLLHM